ncbi:MAG: YlbF family regulator [Oscillospiraceae bacterium]|nr:YlbF family regulator [Oscillospiraceae bacterium]
MQDIKQLTRELGAALQLAPEYVRFVAAQEANDADEALGEQLRALGLLRMQYRHEAAKRDDADAALMEEYNAKFEALYDQIMGNEGMAEHKAAAEGLNGLLQWMTGVLQGCAQGQDPAVFEPSQAGCGGGNCGGCTGCG